MCRCRTVTTAHGNNNDTEGGGLCYPVVRAKCVPLRCWHWRTVGSAGSVYTRYYPDVFLEREIPLLVLASPGCVLPPSWYMSHRHTSNMMLVGMRIVVRQSRSILIRCNQPKPTVIAVGIASHPATYGHIGWKAFINVVGRYFLDIIIARQHRVNTSSGEIPTVHS